MVAKALVTFCRGCLIWELIPCDYLQLCSGLSSHEVQVKPLYFRSLMTWTLILTSFFCSVLFEDQDSYLCNVTLFRKAVDDFKHKAREYKWVLFLCVLLCFEASLGSYFWLYSLPNADFWSVTSSIMKKRWKLIKKKWTDCQPTRRNSL